MAAIHTLPAYEPPRGRPLRDWRARRPRQDAPLRVLPPTPPGPTWGEPPEMHHRLVRLVATLLEVLDGSRPVAQLKMLITEDVRAAATARAQEASGVRYRLRRLHSCRPTERAIELTAIATTGVSDQDRAVAVRLDRRTDGWVCTALEVIA